MKSIPAALEAHLNLDETTLALCWKIVKTDGNIIRGTEHDSNIVISSGTYAGTYVAGSNVSGSDLRTTSDFSVDNMEVEGAFQTDSAIMDLSVADIEAGLLDNALVTVIVVNWRSPSDGVMVVRHGNLGQLTRDSDGKYKTEIRGLTQRLSQQIGYTYGERCNVVQFGDSRCGVDVETLRAYGSVTAVTSRRRFIITTGSPNAAQTYPAGGQVRFTTGANAGYERQIKRVLLSGVDLDIELWEAFPNDVAVSDVGSVIPGCDRTFETCLGVYNNVVNFRGYGLFIPGALRMMAGASTGNQDTTT